ncbi:MAG: CNNM domain-containing protein [Crocosphaera sp.]|nr:CNNM domain-containing protein [Crocosphaera sp.]
MLNIIFVVLIVLAGSAICACAETALFSVSRVRVKQLAQSKKPAAIVLQSIRSKMNRPIATIVILNNIFNIVGSIVIGSLAAKVLGDAWLGLFSSILTFLIIVCGEIVPKTIGERYSEPIATQKINQLLRQVYYVPETIKADKLLKTFQDNCEHLMVVLDEYGGVAGVVTLEDVLEVLTGEIVDETDRIINLQEIARKKRKILLNYRGINS